MVFIRYLIQQHNIHSFHVPNTFTKIDCIIGHKTSLNKFKRIRAMQSMFFEHNEKHIKNQQQKDSWEISQIFCKLNNTFLKYSCVNEETKEKSEDILN